MYPLFREGVMKIYGNKPSVINDPSSNIQKTTSLKQKENTTSTAAEETVSKDKVEISGRMKELMALISQIPEVRNDKLEAIKKAIESGNYKIDPLKIAERILREL
jgi:negative regulator of flagellin synthesis FlgM